MPAKIFLSAVSTEFHAKDPARPQSFESYRDVLTRSLRLQIPGCEVIVQEELNQGFADLLETLDDEVGRSNVVIHLIGDAAGARPTDAELRRLRERHAEFLAHEPELAARLGDGAGASYTQWEAYLAFEHRRARLIFVADPTSPRSPRFSPDADQKAAQSAHLERIQTTGEHYQPCYSQSDLAVRSVVAIERNGLNPLQAGKEPSAESVEMARADADSLVAEIATSLRGAAKEASEYDPARIEQFLRAIDIAALKRELDRRAALNVVAQARDERVQTAEAEPTAENFQDLALAELAMGNYHDAIVAARRAIEQEVRQMSSDPTAHDKHRDRVLSGHLLWRDAASFAGLRAETERSLNEGSRFTDAERDPILWADYHEEIARLLLDHAQLDRAEELIDAILDIREEHQPEPNPALAKSLLLWCELLQLRGKYEGVVSVAKRAERINEALQSMTGIAGCLGYQTAALVELTNYREAEPLMRKALAIVESSFGAEDSRVAGHLNNLGLLLHATNRSVEAEPLLRRALKIEEASAGTEHSRVAGHLNNLAQLLHATCRLVEAEPLMRRALAIGEAALGTKHPNVARELNNLALLLRDTNRPEEAELLMRRALAIDEVSLGAKHPIVANRLNNLAALLQDANRLEEAESLMWQAFSIVLSVLGSEHPRTLSTLHNYLQLLEATGLSESEAVARTRRKLEGET